MRPTRPKGYEIGAMIGRILFGAIDLGFALAQAGVDTYDRAKRLGRALLPRGREQPFPLTHRHAERQAQFARCAGHESEPRCSTIRPPPPAPR